MVVDLGALVSYREGEFDPKQLYFDLFDTQISPKLTRPQIQVGDALLSWIRIAQPQATVTRVVLDLNVAVTPKIFTLADPPRLVVDLKARPVAGQALTQPDAGPPYRVGNAPERGPGTTPHHTGRGQTSFTRHIRCARS